QSKASKGAPAVRPRAETVPTRIAGILAVAGALRAAPRVGCRADRLAGLVIIARDRHIRIAVVAVQFLQDVAVKPVDVGTRLEFAGVIGVRRLIGDVDRNRMLEGEAPLAVAIHRTDLGGGVM